MQESLLEKPAQGWNERQERKESKAASIIGMDIDGHIAELTAKLIAATGIQQYETKLRDNAVNEGKLEDLLSEGRAAAMFLDHGWQVVLRDSPDLQITFDGDVIYAEVKRFRQKEQDKLNDEAMSGVSGRSLALMPDVTESEGMAAWEQCVQVAIKKASQYMEGAANILVVESDSDCLELTASSIVREYDSKAFASTDRRLRRLDGIMLVNKGWATCGAFPSNVEFCQTRYVSVPLGDRVATALRSSIRLG